MSDFWYDGQIRRYVTQFMRVFIGLQYKAGDTLRQIPVIYGDMSRQTAAVINENSENKLPTVPKFACYITSLAMDTNRLADSSFVSKVNIRERRWTQGPNGREYQNVQGAGYTVERLMPTPYKLGMKADLWTTSTDQKLQILEQLLVLFNPSLELQTTDNYVDWTSISVLNLTNINFSSKTVPAAETEIDICSLDFEIPIWLTPPAKVKKLGIVQSIIANMYTDNGEIIDLDQLIYDETNPDGTIDPDAPLKVQFADNRYDVLLLKSENGQPYDYNVTLVDKSQAALSFILQDQSIKFGQDIDWRTLLELRGGYQPGSKIYFRQPNGYEIVGTFVINELDPTTLIATLDQDTIPTNTLLSSAFDTAGKTYVNAIIDPYKFNPLTKVGGRDPGVRYLMLDDVNPNNANTDGPDAWKNLNGTDPVIRNNSIIEWNGSAWIEIWSPGSTVIYQQNLRTGIQYKWDGSQWVKSFEGEYIAGSWGFISR